MSPDKSNPTALLPLLQNRLIPWSQDNARQRLVVARPMMEAAQLPNGVQLERRELRGRRRIIKGHRLYDNSRLHSAEWPEDGLIEIEVPKLVCVVSGQADFAVGEYLLTCNAGHFILMPPRTPHPDGKHPHLEGEHREDGSCDLLQILAVHRGIHCWLCRSQDARHFHIPMENYLIRSEQAAQLLHLLTEEAVAREENYEAVCEHLLATLLLLLHREIKAGHYLLPHLNTAPEAPAATPNDNLTELNAYILGHLNQPLTLESVARQMHLSRAQFARRIRRQTGKTFVAYLTEHRLQEAQILLRESEWTTAAISQFVGFKSSTYFHRLFRDKTGMTPGEYRRASRRKARPA